MTIPIGITARNESKNILTLLHSLRTAIAHAGRVNCTFEIHVLLNDNCDETPALLSDQHDVTVWHTTGGIVEAQRALVERYDGRVPFLLFSDADIIIDPDALVEIVRVMLDSDQVEIAYAEKHPVTPLRRTPLALALYFYNLREGYQTKRHYLNGQFFAIRHWHIPKPHELHWEAASDSPFLNLSAGIRGDDIYLSRELLSRAGPHAIRCVDAGIRYRPPETLRGMFRKYQRMRLELERMECFFPHTRNTHAKWGRRARDNAKLAAAPFAEQVYYAIFQAALLLCKAAYRTQKFYFTNVAKRPCPHWTPVMETKERMP